MQVDTEKHIFLDLCCPHDKDLLMDKEEMTITEFERLTYLTMTLGLSHYTQWLHMKYIGLTKLLSEQLDREFHILEDYPAYYLDEQEHEKHQQWINDFLNHLPADKQNEYHELLENNNSTL